MTKEKVTKQVMLKLQLRRTPESIQDEINEHASEGYRYGGIMRFLDKSGGGIYVIKAKGVYTFRAMLWLDPAPAPSEFHVHRIQTGRKRIDLAAKISETAALENEMGFLLKEALPLDGFVSSDGYRHPGTAGCFLIYEKTQED